MVRGQRAKAGMYDDACDAQYKGLFECWCDTPAPHLKNFEVTDVTSFTIRIIDTNEIVAHWDNPKYIKSEE